VLIDHAASPDGDPKYARGFCAGGDIRMVAESGKGDGAAARRFFFEEYRMNHALFTYAKPVVTVMDGVTMGGGVGISLPAKVRIATENTRFAMPETGIGLFPDVGGGWFLPRLNGQLGTWLALTGARLKGADVAAAGIATHLVASADIAAIKAALLAGEGPDQVLPRFAQGVPAPTYGEHIVVMDRCFDQMSVTAIIDALRAEQDDWATEQADILATRSPLSMCVALEQLRRGREMTDFAEVMRMEYRIACRILRSHDFSEGVRAVLEDKDHKPLWSPASVREVTPEMIAAVFAPLARELA
jgi:enoyl-CoA hydratase